MHEEFLLAKTCVQSRLRWNLLLVIASAGTLRCLFKAHIVINRKHIESRQSRVSIYLIPGIQHWICKRKEFVDSLMLYV